MYISKALKHNLVPKRDHREIAYLNVYYKHVKEPTLDLFKNSLASWKNCTSSVVDNALEWIWKFLLMHSGTIAFKTNSPEKN